MAVTVHYIDGKNLIERVLAAEELGEVHTAANIKVQLEGILQKYGFLAKHLVYVSDRGTNIIKALENHVRLNCAAHLIDNVLSRAEESTPEAITFFKACTSLVRYTKKAHGILVGRTTLKSDCATRWNSKYFMCKSIETGK